LAPQRTTFLGLYLRSKITLKGKKHVVQHLLLLSSYEWNDFTLNVVLVLRLVAFYVVLFLASDSSRFWR